MKARARLRWKPRRSNVAAARHLKQTIPASDSKPDPFSPAAGRGAADDLDGMRACRDAELDAPAAGCRACFYRSPVDADRPPWKQANAIRTREGASAAVQPPVSRQTTRQVRGLRLPFRFDAAGLHPDRRPAPGP